MAKKLVRLSPAEEVKAIQEALGHVAEETRVRDWLDTGFPELNRVFGSEASGIPYGKIVELSGFESHGKTALTLMLAGLAQKDGAHVGWLDLENSFDPAWASLRGLDPDQTYLFESIVGTFGKEKAPRLIAAQELCEQVEMWILRKHAQDQNCKLFLGVDSVAALLTEDELNSGLSGANMRTNVSQAAFLSRLLRKWVAYAKAYNVTMIFINQIRVKPGVMFGNPEYTTGGNALPFYASIRVRMRRVKGGKIEDAAKRTVGVRGTLTNHKNKAGGGSQPDAKIGFKMIFAGDTKFMKPTDKDLASDELEEVEETVDQTPSTYKGTAADNGDDE